MANFFDDIISGTRFGANQQRVRESRQRVDLRQLDAEIERILRTVDPQKRANMQALIDKSPLFEKMNKLAAEQGDVPFRTQQDPAAEKSLQLENIQALTKISATTEDTGFQASLDTEAKRLFDLFSQPTDQQIIAADKQDPIDRAIKSVEKKPRLADIAPQVKEAFLGGGEQPVDNRSLFTQGGAAFDQLPEKKVAKKERRSGGRTVSDIISDKVSAIESFFQKGTPASETDNIPKTRGQIGADKNRQMSAQFEEVDSFVQEAQKRGDLGRDFVLQQSFQDNPADFELLFKAMREGVPDGKGGTRKLTKKEWLQALQSMGR